MHFTNQRKTFLAIMLAASSIATYAEEASLEKQIIELTKKVDELDQKTTDNSDSIRNNVSSNPNKTQNFTALPNTWPGL